MQRNVASWRERSAVCCLCKNYGYLGFLVKTRVSVGALTRFYHQPKYRNMNIQKVWDAFIKENDNPSFVKMAYAVVEQLGGVDEDTILNSLDSCRNANDGYTGFCYPYQTSKFWNENKSAIMENMHELADDLGEDLITMIKGFGNFKDDKSVTYDAIGKALYAPFNEGESRNIYDTFAKYALEEVANRFQDWWYDQDESEFDD